jgi:ABC-type arginine transport system permease subunit
LTDVSEVLTACIIALMVASWAMMEAARSSETSIDFYVTVWRNIPEEAIFMATDIDIFTAVRTSDLTYTIQFSCSLPNYIRLSASRKSVKFDLSFVVILARYKHKLKPPYNF